MLFSWSGNPDTSIDVFRWEGEDGWLNQHIFKVTPRNGVSEEFLFFVLRWLRPRFAEIARNKQTTGLGHVTIQDLKRMQVGVPPPEEQGAIVGFVGPLQRKIELNRRMNETLEATAGAIFKDWFVDFGPTRAKQEGCIFPDRLDDEGKPEGWKSGSLAELIEIGPSEPMRKGRVDTVSGHGGAPDPGLHSGFSYPSGVFIRNEISERRYSFSPYHTLP
jgi:type I restriction enzyme, S subunit